MPGTFHCALKARRESSQLSSSLKWAHRHLAGSWAFQAWCYFVNTCPSCLPQPPQDRPALILAVPTAWVCEDHTAEAASPFPKGPMMKTRNRGRTDLMKNDHASFMASSPLFALLKSFSRVQDSQALHWPHSLFFICFLFLIYHCFFSCEVLHNKETLSQWSLNMDRHGLILQVRVYFDGPRILLVPISSYPSTSRRPFL